MSDDQIDSLSHRLDLARAGKHGYASGAEKRARKLVRCVMDNAIGLDGRATAGITELVHLMLSQPQAGDDFVRQAAGIR